jgi:hypothetical protein|nr:MAG TPA: hypothetical protein [Caudoviricetes sp.]
MAKEFDIYLNNRLTECDILVYSIPYRDGLTAIHKLILESCIESYTLQKFIAVQTGSELVHHIDEMLKTCYERLNYATELNVTATFQTHYSLYSDTAGIMVSAECVETLSNLFAKAESAMQLTAQPVMAYTGKSGGNAESSLVINAALEKDIKNSLLTVAPVVEIETTVLGTNKRSAISVSPGIDIACELTNLCYRFYNGAETVIQMAADVLATELHYSLGEGTSAIELSADIVDGDCSTKYEEFETAVIFVAEVVEAIQQFMHPELHSIAIGLAVDPILKRHRLLSEMDADNLSAYDNMLLEEIDYVII